MVNKRMGAGLAGTGRRDVPCLADRAAARHRAVARVFRSDRSRLLGRWLLLLVLMLVTMVEVGAAELQIRPLRLTLDAKTPVGQLLVVNTGEREALIQVDGFDWSQPDGMDVLSPTVDLLINPAVFRLPPRGAQVVRIGVRETPDGRSERPFRLVFQDVMPKRPEGSGLQLSLRVSLPVFVRTGDAGSSELQWRVAPRSDGAGVEIEARNTGNRHAVVTALGVASGRKPWIAATRTSPSLYLLPGAIQRWRLNGGAYPAGTRLRLEAAGRGGNAHGVATVR